MSKLSKDKGEKVNNFAGKAIIIFGDNSFERVNELSRIYDLAKKGGFIIENVNSENLTTSDMPSLLNGVSLLADKRLIVVKNLSDNKEIWSQIPDLVSKIASEIILVDVEDKLDKRTKIFKDISTVSDMREFKNLTQKDEGILAERARILAEKSGLKMAAKDANFLIYWVGIDEWKVKSAISRLSLIGSSSEDMIRKYIPQTIEQNVFGIFELAINGNAAEITNAIGKLSKNDNLDEAYQFFGLVSSQFFNLWALKIGLGSGKTVAGISKDLGVNSWAMSKMESMARSCSDGRLKKIAKLLNETDVKLKNSSGSSWDLMENLLLEIAINTNE